MPTITPSLWFDDDLEEAMAFYTSVFPNCYIEYVHRYTEAGPVGLLEGKRAIVIESRGGLYSEGPAKVMDSQEPHLRTLLGFMGIKDVTFVHAEKLGFGPEAREHAITTARARLREVVTGDHRRAA